MNVHPDGDALSEWERQILDEMEQDFEVGGHRPIALLFPDDPLPLYVLAASLVAAEAALTFAALTVPLAAALAGLATMSIGTTIWVTSVHRDRR
jgi:hypothetical protein